MGIRVIYVMLYGWFMYFVFVLKNTARILHDKLHVDMRIYQSAICKLPMDYASLFDTCVC